MSFFVAAFTFFELTFKTAALVFGIVEFAEAVGDFHLAGKNFEALGPVGIIGLLL